MNEENKYEENSFEETQKSLGWKNDNDFVSVSLSNMDIEAIGTETIRYDQFVKWLLKPGTEQIVALHCAIGIAGEAGEIADEIKIEYIYGKPRNLKHIIEELGDLEFYIQALRSHYNISRQQILQANADKLSVRYSTLRYSDEQAIARADESPGE